MVSNFTSDQTSLYASARLIWTTGFEESDIGTYTCMVQGADTTTDSIQSKSVSLELTILTTDNPTSPAQCSLNMSRLTTYFQIRVLDIECLSWDETSIILNFSNIVLSIIKIECSDCNIRADNVEIMGPPTCSNLTQRAALFRGSIVSQQTSRVERIFCALSSWKQRRPIIMINNRYHFVDSNCSLMFDSNTGNECPAASIMAMKPPPQVIPAVIGAITGTAGLTIVSVFLILSLIGFVLLRKKSLSKVDSIVGKEMKDIEDHDNDSSTTSADQDNETESRHNSLIAGLYHNPEDELGAGVHRSGECEKRDVRYNSGDREEGENGYSRQKRERRGSGGQIHIKGTKDANEELHRRERRRSSDGDIHLLYERDLHGKDPKKKRRDKSETRSNDQSASGDVHRTQHRTHRKDAKKKKHQKEVEPAKFDIPTIIISTD